MATDTAIDFATHDYIDDGEGSWLETEDSRATVLYQLECRYGAWFGDPTAGSRLKELLERSDPTSSIELRDEALRALQVLVDSGVISELVVTIDESGDEAGRAVILLHYRDRTTGDPVDVAYSPWGGSP